MRSKHFFGLLFAGLSMAAVAAGCGGDDTTPSSTSTTSGSGGSGTTTTGTGGTGTTTTGTGGNGTGGTGGGTVGDGNDTPETATDLELEKVVQASLDPTGDVDYYKFHGTKGQALGIIIASQAIDQLDFDPDHLDTIVTLFDANKQQIAENDDPDPRSSNDASLFTILPADGDYYLRVEECWTWIEGKQNVGCADPKDKTFTDYNLFVTALDPSQDAIVMDAEKSNDETNPTTVTYATNDMGQYYLTQIYGTFTGQDDVDTFLFNMPDPGGTPGESVGNFSILKSGTDGNGSTSQVGTVYITDAATPSIKIAEIDGTLTPDLSPPLQFGHDYLLFVQHPASAAGTNDFYFINHNASGSNPLETEVAVGGNDVWAKAELLDPQTVSAPELAAYFVEGKILPAPADTDFFKFDLPTPLDPAAKISIACSAQRSGSGLRSLKFELTDGTGTAIANASKTEAADTDAFLQDANIPANATTLGLKITAASQDASVTSSFYRCGIHVAVPAM